MDDETRARIKKAAQFAADHGGKPDVAFLPADMIDQVDCKPEVDVHVYPGLAEGTICKCGRSKSNGSFAHLFDE